MSRDTISWGRRRVLRMTGISAAGIIASGQTETVVAQSSDASITIEDQETDGDTVVVASAQTDVESRLIIISERKVDGSNIGYRSIQLDPGTSFSDRTIELDRSISESQQIRAEIRSVDGSDELFARDRATVAVGESLDTVRPTTRVIEADPDAGFHSQYFLFLPETSDSAEASVNNSRTRPLLVQTYPWGNDDERAEGARGRAERGWIANEMNCPLLVAPLRFRADSSKFGLRPGTEMSDPKYGRTDLQLLAMIEDAKSRLADEAYTVAEQIHYQGGSSAGVFIDLFAALHPEHVEVFSSGANGMAFLPFAELSDDIPIYGDPNRTTVPWPIGAAEFEELVGKEFNKDAWMTIDQLQWIGAEDQDPENPDEYIHKTHRGSSRYDRNVDLEFDRLVEEIFGTLQVDHRFETTRKIYDHLEVPATFTAFEGAGHVPEPRHYNIIDEFHQQKIVENYQVIHLVPQEFSSEIQANDTLSVPILAENPTAVSSGTTVTLTIDGTEADTTDVQVGPDSTKTVELEATIEEPGEYTLRINDGQSESSLTVVEADTATEDANGNSTGDDTETDSGSESEQAEQTAAEQPGFGIGQTLAAIGGIGYLIKRHISDNS